MGRRGRRRKIADYENRFRCGGGIGVLRVEVWADESGAVCRYNLAFLLPHVLAADNGRILGFDNAHGIHERHYMGEVEACEFINYASTAERFYREAEEIRRRYENEGIL